MAKLKWTYEACKKEALKYSNRSEYQKSNGSSYNRAKKEGWLDDICDHMERLHLPNGYWSFDKCKEEVNKYSTIKDFRVNSESCYNIILSNGWKNLLCSHMERAIKINGYWGDKNNCLEEALKYKTKTEFSKKSNRAYKVATINGWLDEICSHMEKPGNKYKRFIYAYEFPDNYVYVGLTFKISKRHSDHKIKGEVFKHAMKTGLTPILKQLTSESVDVEVAKELENYYLQDYMNKGWFKLNKAKTGGLGGNNCKWNYETLLNEAFKYKHRSQFEKMSNSAYNTALKLGIINEICKHMTPLKKPDGYWTLERCIEEAKKHKNISSIQSKNGGCYVAICRNKWKDEVKKHFSTDI